MTIRRPQVIRERPKPIRPLRLRNIASPIVGVGLSLAFAKLIGSAPDSDSFLLPYIFIFFGLCGCFAIVKACLQKIPFGYDGQISYIHPKSYYALMLLWFVCSAAVVAIGFVLIGNISAFNR